MEESDKIFNFDGTKKKIIYSSKDFIIRVPKENCAATTSKAKRRLENHTTEAKKYQKDAADTKSIGNASKVQRTANEKIERAKGDAGRLAKRFGGLRVKY